MAAFFLALVYNGIMKNALKSWFALAFFALLAPSCASAGGYGFLTTATDRRDPPSMAILEAIRWPKDQTPVGECVVEMMVANLFYGTDSDGNVYPLSGSEDLPVYDFESIVLSFVCSGETLLSFSIDVTEYNRKDNGVLFEKRASAGANDFKLLAPFNLGECSFQSGVQSISFLATYSQRKTYGTEVFSRGFTGVLEERNGIISLSRIAKT